MVLTVRRQLSGARSGARRVRRLRGGGLRPVSELKIAERYHRDRPGEGLVADVVRRRFLVETYLTVHQMLGETDRRRLDDLIRQGQELRAAFEERHAHWEKTLAPGPLREALLKDGYEPGAEFLRVKDEGDPGRAARRHGGGPGDRRDPAQAAEQHRKALLDVVQLARQATQREEREGLALARQRTTLVPVVGILLAAVTVSIGLFLSRRIVARSRRRAGWPSGWPTAI